jgi:D-glycero-D-manno-heptose 1,7-bisphosphate phosphatase
MRQEIKTHGGDLADVIVCTDTPDRATYRRKPKPGMLIEALEKYKAIAADTAFIGDAITDLEAGLAAGCKRYLVMTGKGEKTQHSLPDSLQPVVRCKDILDAAQRIISGA